ncbi:MAG: pyridoxamine 5'-phosphate oxidase family protein [Acidobacteria bacterium]|nr:pyridoxamine 5'-phosphate oxidase family protein [Acidobacteriota bacterium]
MAKDFRGTLGGLDAELLETFLGHNALARLACLKPDGSPYVVPVWYHWDGEALWFVGRQRSAWCKYIQNDGRVSVVIDSEHSPPDESGQRTEIPKVMMEGIAEIIEEPNVGGKWVQIAEKMSYRYLGPNGPEYLTGTINQPRWLIKMTPSKVKTWQGVGWARRYWVEGQGGATYEEAHGE